MRSVSPSSFFLLQLLSYNLYNEGRARSERDRATRNSLGWVVRWTRKEGGVARRGGGRSGSKRARPVVTHPRRRGERQGLLRRLATATVVQVRSARDRYNEQGRY